MKLESSNLNRIAKVILVTSAAGVGLGLSAGRLLAATSYEPYTFTHFAGSLGGPGYTDGTGSAARFSSASGMAVDSSGNVYVADTGNNMIRSITLEDQAQDWCQNVARLRNPRSTGKN